MSTEWKLVPARPTPEMIKAADAADRKYTDRVFGEGAARVAQSGYDHWMVMIAAAPQPPAVHQGSSPTAGMTLWQRIEHVGGRINAASYVEFGSVMAVDALISHVLRDLPPAPGEAAQPADVVAVESGASEPNWDYVRYTAEHVTGMPVERHSYSIIVREVRRWLADRQPQIDVARLAEVPTPADVARLVDLLREAAATFRRYEALHRAKSTADGDAKAEANAALAGRIEAALAAKGGA